MADDRLNLVDGGGRLAGDGSRFARLESISWWDQRKLDAAKVVVVGAGALGNEIVKNLALLGVGHVLILDRDRIELSNLSRSVLYRDTDVGRPKAEVAAAAARQIFPGIRCHGLTVDVINALGAGVFRWADVVIGGLDNREARLHVNRQCWRVGRPWIDGAIEQIQGVARTFVPDAQQANPCYECTLGEADFRLLAQRRSCNMLTRAQMETGHTPTTPTIASIIAGIQVQEAIKRLHGLPAMSGSGIAFVGQTCETFPVSYPRRPDCFGHETLAQVVAIEAAAHELTARDLLHEARALLGPDATIELGRDVVERFDCARCGSRRDVFAPLGGLSVNASVCDCDGETRGDPILFHRLDGSEAFLDRACAAIGIPPFEIVTARDGDRAIGLELAGDASLVLGPLAPEGLTWN